MTKGEKERLKDAITYEVMRYGCDNLSDESLLIVARCFGVD